MSSNLRFNDLELRDDSSPSELVLLIKFIHSVQRLTAIRHHGQDGDDMITDNERIARRTRYAEEVLTDVVYSSSVFSLCLLTIV